jgi:hypothetical protein
MRKLMVVAGAFSIAMPLTFLIPGTASAATCSGYGCDGVSATASGCSSDAYTAEQVNVYDSHESGIELGYVQLRYSPSCRTVWAKTVNFNEGYVAAVVHRNSDGVTESCSGGTYSSSYGGWACQTNMLYDGNVTSYAWGELEDSLGYDITAQTSSY